MFAIGVRYLAGFSVATDIARREPPEQAEWPPHPARLFMALAAAYFETGEDPAEGEALEWLEKQTAPDMLVPAAVERSPVTCYVPVNDQKGLEALPSKRSRQARTFPRMALEYDQPLFFSWREDVPKEHINGLKSLCMKVIRLGHSSSLVQVWLERNGSALSHGELGNHERWATGSGLNGRKLRIAAPGTLSRLRSSYNAEAVASFADLQMRIGLARGKETKMLKAQLEERFGEHAPTSRRPVIRSRATYVRVGQLDRKQAVQGFFDDDILVLSKVEGPNLTLETTLRVASALRGTIHSQFKQNRDIPAWISGHAADGSPLQEPHLSMIPFGYVSETNRYADGHLLGVGLVFPRSLPARERAKPLRGLLIDSDGMPKRIKLLLGALGEWELEREIRPSPPLALQANTWTRESTIWASVTPIVLDRYPKADREDDRVAWTLETAKIVASACRNVGLPEPAEIDIDKTSWHRGAPRACPARRGYPLMPERSGKPCRHQVHAYLRFDEPVRGPVILGAGRYLGYGLCKPLRRRERELSDEGGAV